MQQDTPRGSIVEKTGQLICAIDTTESAIAPASACKPLCCNCIVSGSMASASRKLVPPHPSFPGKHNGGRRIIVVVVPPVDELDLVGPLQVFNSINRLVGRNIYAIEVVTNADGLTVEGEGGVLTFLANNHFNKVEGTCDSVLLVCGLGTRSTRDAALSAWLK